MKNVVRIFIGGFLMVVFLVTLVLAGDDDSNETAATKGTDTSNPKEIIAKTLERNYEDLKLHVKLIKVTRTGREREMELDVYIKESPQVTKTLVTFTSPPEIKGMTSLSWDYAGKPADRWFKLLGMNYVKCIGKACQNMEERFGFSMEIFSIDIEDAKHKFLGEEKIDGAPCYKVESEAVIENTEGSRFITWVDKEMFAARKIEAYDENGEKTQVSRFTGFDKIGDHWWETKGKLNKLDSGKEVRFEIVSHEINTGLKDELFEKPENFNLKKD